MLQFRWCLALVAVTGLAVAARGQDKPVKLEWKFEKDKTFYQTMTTSTQQKMKVMGNDISQNQDQTFYFSWTPIAEDKDKKSWQVKQKIEGVKMTIDIGGNKIEYDSSKADSAGTALADFFKQLVGSEFTLTLARNKDDRYQVTNIDGREQFLKKLVTANPQMEPLLNQILSKQALEEMANPTFAAIPNKEVKKGDTWTAESDLNMGPIGTYKNTYKYTYEGQDNKLDKIKVDTTLTYQPPTESTNALPFKIKSADLKSTNAGGTILFDREKGRVQKSEMKMDLKGDLQIEIGSQTTRVELTQTQKTSVETSDTNPVGKKS